MTGAVVLRPEPGNAATAAALAAAGIAALRCPLFVVRPVAWVAPDPALYDALLLTSANAVRHAGPGLAALANLPVVAVGEATAAAARAAGLAVTRVGDGDAARVVAASPGRRLHLAGHDRGALAGVDQLTVYESAPLPIDAGVAARWADHVAMLHSTRAAARVAALVDRGDRATIAIVAISAAVARAAGEGWAQVAVAAVPTDAAMIACVAALIGPSIDRPAPATDKCRA